MFGNGLRRTVLLLLLLLVSSLSISFSQVTLTDEEYIVIMNSLDKAQRSVTTSNEALMRSMENEKALGKTIELLNQQISLYSLNWNMQLESSEMQRKEQQRRNMVYFGVGLISGMVSGFTGGIAAGAYFSQ